MPVLHLEYEYQNKNGKPQLIIFNRQSDNRIILTVTNGHNELILDDNDILALRILLEKVYRGLD